MTAAPDPYRPGKFKEVEVLGLSVLIECSEDFTDVESGAGESSRSSRTSSSTVVSESTSESTSLTDSSFTSTPPSSPSVDAGKHWQRSRHPFQQKQTIGVDPTVLVNKTLKRARRSTRHPCATMHFDDGTTYQILVDGYDPRYPGVPKSLEMDAFLERIFEYPRYNDASAASSLSSSSSLDLLIVGCRLVDLADKAFERRTNTLRTSSSASASASSSTSSSTSTSGPACALAPDSEEYIRWDQRHLGIAFKFAGEPEEGGHGGCWHCVYATLAVYDPELQMCVFRNFEDVYLEPIGCIPGPLALQAVTGTSTGIASAYAPVQPIEPYLTSLPSSPVKASFHQPKSPKKHRRRSSKVNSNKLDAENKPFDTIF